ncbi:MAG TPA: FHA domain-containing protein [Thermoanaerobaculia bacterium]|nr:FHA domain-containing protein [Thermoanaerobaculia bacterium]
MGRPRTIEEAVPPLVAEGAAADSGNVVSPASGSSRSGAKLPEGKRLSLAIINGPNSGMVFRLEKPRIVIGRSSADFILNDSESSRAHAAVEARDPLVLLEDLGSTNGTLVDGARIQRPVELQNHSEFQVGATTIMLIVTDEA